MATRFNTALQNVVADAAAGQFDGGALEIYTGAQPAVNDLASGTLLATVNIPTPAFDAAAGGEASKTGSWSGVAVATGDAGWFRMKNAAGTQWQDGSITVLGGGGDMELSSLTIPSGETVIVNTSTITQPAE